MDLCEQTAVLLKKKKMLFVDIQNIDIHFFTFIKQLLKGDIQHQFRQTHFYSDFSKTGNTDENPVIWICDYFFCIR
jgi:hypothetical protein